MSSAAPGVRVCEQSSSDADGTVRSAQRSAGVLNEGLTLRSTSCLDCSTAPLCHESSRVGTRDPPPLSRLVIAA